MAASKPGASAAAKANSDREIFATRIVDAPRELVWKMWTDPERISKWWGPNGFTTTTSLMDVRPGGGWEHVMHGPDGRDYQNKIVYLEVVKPERIVYDHESYPPFRATATFEAQGEKTIVSMQMVFDTSELRNKTAKDFGAIEGLQQTLGRLGKELRRISEIGVETTLELGGRPFTISRTFDAPREIVWKAWTEAERLAKWWGPKGFAITVAKLELLPGGIFHYTMKLPDGQVMWGRFTYRQISAPERLEFVVSFSDQAGSVTRAPFSADWPLEVLSIVTLEEQAGKTTVTMRGFPINATEVERKMFEAGFESMREGWTGTLDQLADFFAVKQLVLTRQFAAPRALVFKAWTDPKQMAKWWGPKGFTNPVCELDAHTGGKIRIDMRGPDGVEIPMLGVFNEVVEPERLMFTCFAHFDAVGNPEIEVVNSVTFEEVNGKTKLTIHARVFEAPAPTVTGMEQGWSESLERLGELVDQGSGQ
jgi:uncharacterized protein YndB with AHSA1/START domain